jgi:hypothetical protein
MFMGLRPTSQKLPHKETGNDATKIEAKFAHFGLSYTRHKPFLMRPFDSDFLKVGQNKWSGQK